MVDLPAFIIIFVFWEHFNSSFVLKHQQHILKLSRLRFYFFINTINKEGDPLACIGYLNNNVKSDQAFTYRNTILLKWVPLTQGIIRCFNWNFFRRIFSTLYLFGVYIIISLQRPHNDVYQTYGWHILHTHFAVSNIHLTNLFLSLKMRLRTKKYT